VHLRHLIVSLLLQDLLLLPELVGVLPVKILMQKVNLLLMRNNAQQVSLKFYFCDVELIVNQFQEELLKKIDVFKLDTTQDSNLLIAEVHIVEELRYKQNSAQNKSETLK
jgi:hypothetical protein